MADEEQEKTRYQETVQAHEDIEVGRVVDGKKVLDWIAGWGTDSEADPPDSAI